MGAIRLEAVKVARFGVALEPLKVVSKLLELRLSNTKTLIIGSK